MPAYYYEGAYANGERVTGTVEANSRDEAVIRIRQNCDMVISVKEIKQTGSGDEAFSKKISAKSLSLVCQQFSIILKAGLPLVQAVDLTAAQSQDKTLAKILRQVSRDVSNGWSLSYSLQQRGKRFPPTFIETVRSGEESGDLVAVFERLSNYYDRMYKTRSKATSALMYPAFVLVVAVVVVAIVMLYAVPAFAETFDSLGGEMPAITKFLIAASDFFRKYIIIIVLVIAGTLFAVRLYGLTDKGHENLSRLQLNIPVFGKISSMTGSSQFAHTMCTMLTAGMPILQAIEVAGHSISNYCMSKAILGTIGGVESGQTLGECMSRSPDLPEMLVKMTAIGESTGSLEETLRVMAEYYDNESDTASARALSLLEPVIILMLAGIVVVILFAVYLPMFTMYGNM